MAKKEFSQDFNAVTGLTDLFKLMVENPNTGAEYYATMRQLMDAYDGNVMMKKSAIENLARTNDMGRIIGDSTFSAPWLNGCIYDEDNEFYMPNHGFGNGDVIEFNANGGILPGGVVAYNNWYGDTADYYNVLVISSSKFKISAAPGSIVPKNITSDGSGPWQVRKTITGAMINLPPMPDNLNYIEIDIIANYGARNENYGLSYLMINGNGSYFALGSRGGVAMYVEETYNYSKYTTLFLKVKIKKLSGGYYQVDVITNKISTADFASYNTSNCINLFKIFTTDIASALYVGSNNAINMQFRSIRAITIQQ